VPRAAVRLLPVLALWAAAGGALAAATTRVVDWFVMNDELLYERLALSVASSGSPWPTLRGEHIPIGNNLYPLILSLVAKHDYVPAFLHRAHLLNAFLITSAAVPAFLLARDALRSTLAASAVAALTVLVPWVVLASFLLTENAAYPAFVWGVYLVHRTVRSPSAVADLLATAATVVALIARTQFVVLLIAAPLAILVHERSPRAAFLRHRVLAAALVALVAAVGLFAAAGHGSTVLGFYSSTTQGSLDVGAVPRAFVARASAREPFATVAVIVITLLAAEVASFDLRFGGNIPRDRYLFYVAPLFATGFVGAALDRRAPRASLAIPLAILLVGFETAPLPVFEKLNVDTPAAIVDDYMLRSGHGTTGARNLLVACTLLLIAVFGLGRVLAGRRIVAVVLIAAAAAATTAETVYAFDRLFRVNGTSGRPITLAQGVVFDWVDRTIGTGKDVTIVPYAQVPGDYWATAGWWWDMEFWNRSVTRGAYIRDEYAEIQSTFPKLKLRFDPRTGRANISPTRYVAQSERDGRFRMRGRVVSLTRGVLLLDAGGQWRADWLTSGLDDDGFAIPGRTATIRVYPFDGQRFPRVRSLTLHLLATNGPVGAVLRWHGGRVTVHLAANAETDQGVSLCVPPHAPAVLTLAPHGAATVWGNLAFRAGLGEVRTRGIWLNRMALADEIGPHCTP
jgi:hypothetical protein